MNPYPTVRIIEEGMREGMQIESAEISVKNKIRLLDALSATGLETIVVGSFVSSEWTPQMARIDEILEGFNPVPGVTYTALALNDRGRERMRSYMPPLSEPAGYPRTMVHLCDVFARRNTNRSQEQEIARWPVVIRNAVAAGVGEAGIGINAAWGSNWTGEFDEELRMSTLARQHELWSEAGVAVTRAWIGDPMGWNLPHHVASQVRAMQARWPEIQTYHLHLHNARGSALVSAYAALQALEPDRTLVLDTSIGGMGGCPYCGHGRMTRMIPTEDLVDLLDELGIPTGIDLMALIEAAHLAEEIVGHPLWGHVSKAGPRPRDGNLFAMDMPFIETEQQAQHFRLGPEVYAGARSPWDAPITSSMRTQ